MEIRLRLLLALESLLRGGEAEDYDYGPVFERLEKRLPELIRQASRLRDEEGAPPSEPRRSPRTPEGGNRARTAFLRSR